MADEKSIVKMNKMIHKKTGASFLVYVIYVSLVYTDSKKTASCLLPRHTGNLCNFWKAIKMPTCTHTCRFISVPLCSGQSELASVCLFVFLSNLIVNLMYNIKKLYFNDQHKFRVQIRFR